MRFTVDDVLAMMELGVIPEDATTELLDGLVVLKDRSDLGDDPLMHVAKHRQCIRRLIALVARVDDATREAQVQLPIVCAEIQMPEPDFAIVRKADYSDRLPSADDTFVIIEAADSSLERDSKDKLSIYAVAGIPQYVILNLRDSTAIEFTGPDAVSSTYKASRVLASHETITLNGGPAGTVQVRVADLLPS